MAQRVGRWKTIRLTPVGQRIRSFKRDNADTWEKQRKDWINRGTFGAAGPCKKIDPVTGQVIGVIEAKGEEIAEPQAEV